MMKTNREDLAQTEASARYLLAARAKQIRHLKEEIDGLREAMQLAGAFMALFALSAAHEPNADSVVTCAHEDEHTREITVSKQGLAQVLSVWRAQISNEEECYRVLFERADGER